MIHPVCGVEMRFSDDTRVDLHVGRSILPSMALPRQFIDVMDPTTEVLHFTSSIGRGGGRGLASVPGNGQPSFCTTIQSSKRISRESLLVDSNTFRDTRSKPYLLPGQSAYLINYHPIILRRIQMGKLDGKVAFITAAARGQGRKPCAPIGKGRR